MIQASISNKREFALVAEALVAQHVRIHLGEKRRAAKGSAGKGASKGSYVRRDNKGKGKGKGKKGGKGSWSSAFMAEFATDEWDYD
eukprot:5163692-Lingulodinium_polyedra.AAC.1